MDEEIDYIDEFVTELLLSTIVLCMLMGNQLSVRSKHNIFTN